MRMLMNNLDPDVAERPEDLVVYGGTGRAARSWDAFDAIVRSLRDLGDDETLAECAAQRFDGTLAGTITLTGGLGGMGGAQPLAVTMNDGVAICVEVDPARIERRIKTRYLDRETDSIDEALRWAEEAKAAREPLSIGLLGNCAEVEPDLLARGFRPEIVTDQTSAHDPLGGYVPTDMSLDEAAKLRDDDPEEYEKRAFASMGRHVEAMVGFLDAGSVVFDYGNNLRAGAETGGFDRAYAYPGFVPAFVRPMFCEGKGPFRWAALSGDPEDIEKTDRAVAELFPDDERLRRWLDMAEERVAFQGLPARICWLGYGQRAKAGLRFNEMVASGELSAPIVIGRDHLDSGSVASPYRETEGMKDGSDAIADWPILNALINTAAGAHWVSVHHGGGVGIGYAIHAGMVVVADGSENAAERLDRVLTTDPGTGVIRHADAGYERALEVAAARGVRLPWRD